MQLDLRCSIPGANPNIWTPKMANYGSSQPSVTVVTAAKRLSRYAASISRRLGSLPTPMKPQDMRKFSVKMAILMQVD